MHENGVLITKGVLFDVIVHDVSFDSAKSEKKLITGGELRDVVGKQVPTRWVCAMKCIKPKALLVAQGALRTLTVKKCQGHLCSSSS